MPNNKTSESGKEIGSELTLPEIENKQSLSLKQKYLYLEQLRDYIYKDVVLADSKAGLALTVVTIAIAGAIALFKESNIFWILGFIFAGLSIFCSMLTILPRSYVTHEMIKDPDHWVNLKEGWRNEIVRRLRDAVNVIFENLWQKQSKGTTTSLKLLLNCGSDEELVDSLNESMQRAFLAQTLKYLWVGKALIFAFLTFCFIGMSLLLSLNNSTQTNPSTGKQIVIMMDSVALNYHTIKMKDSTNTALSIDSIIKGKKVNPSLK